MYLRHELMSHAAVPKIKIHIYIQDPDSDTTW